MVESESAFFARTVTPREALSMLGPRMGAKVAAPAIIKRLQHGIIAARALRMTVTTFGRVQSEAILYDIDASFWAAAELTWQSPFWETGDLSIRPNDDSEYHVFGVRFVAEAIEHWDPTPPPPKPGPIPPAENITSDAAQPAKPVSQADLEKWAGLFVGIYGSNFTEAFALRSAKAMFPDSAISRDRVRALLPPRKPGRPVSREKVRE